MTKTLNFYIKHICLLFTLICCVGCSSNSFFPDVQGKWKIDAICNCLGENESIKYIEEDLEFFLEVDDDQVLVHHESIQNAVLIKKDDDSYVGHVMYFEYLHRFSFTIEDGYLFASFPWSPEGTVYRYVRIK